LRYRTNSSSTCFLSMISISLFILFHFAFHFSNSISSMVIYVNSHTIVSFLPLNQDLKRLGFITLAIISYANFKFHLPFCSCTKQLIVARVIQLECRVNNSPKKNVQAISTACLRKGKTGSHLIVLVSSPVPKFSRVVLYRC